jgi:hypothetical protein
MRFSIKWLFALVAVAAVFVAAIVYRTQLWAFAAINVAVVALVASSIGVWFQRLDRTFWIPFCAVGWGYVALSFTPSAINRLVHYLPSKQLSHAFRSPAYEDALSGLGIAEIISPDEIVYTTLSPGDTRVDVILEFHRFVDTIDALLALIAGGLAGIITSFLVRQRPEH